jgi:hypothetical protein
VGSDINKWTGNGKVFGMLDGQVVIFTFSLQARQSLGHKSRYGDVTIRQCWQSQPILRPILLNLS